MTEYSYDDGQGYGEQGGDAHGAGGIEYADQEQEPYLGSDPYDPRALEVAALQRAQRQVRDELRQELHETVVGPLQEAQADQGFDRLEADFPVLGPNGDAEVQKQVVAVAEEAAQHAGRPELASDPAFLRTVFLELAPELGLDENGQENEFLKLHADQQARRMNLDWK